MIQQEEKIMVRKFWISVMIAILIPAIGNFAMNIRWQASAEERIKSVTTMVERLALGNAETNARINEIVMTRMDDRFRRSDWQREEEKLDRRLERIETKLDKALGMIVQ